jgi:hypothetical protein
VTGSFRGYPTGCSSTWTSKVGGVTLDRGHPHRESVLLGITVHAQRTAGLRTDLGVEIIGTGDLRARSDLRLQRVLGSVGDVVGSQ